MRPIQVQTAQAGTGVGTAVDVRAFRSIPRQYTDTILVIVVASATSTTQVEVSPDGASYAPFGAAISNSGSIGVPAAPFVRANVTANTGTVNAFAVV